MNEKRRMEKVDVGGMRARNAQILLRLIWEEPEISRAALARRTGLSASTVSAIVGDLVKRGIVRLVRAGASSGGRPPILVDFEAGVFGIAGIEIGATHITVALTDLRGRVLASLETPFEPERTPRARSRKLPRWWTSVAQLPRAHRVFWVPESRCPAQSIARTRACCRS